MKAEKIGRWALQTKCAGGGGELNSKIWVSCRSTVKNYYFKDVHVALLTVFKQLKLK